MTLYAPKPVKREPAEHVEIEEDKEDEQKAVEAEKSEVKDGE
jgi:hypothetical protein